MHKNDPFFAAFLSRGWHKRSQDLFSKTNLGFIHASFPISNSVYKKSMECSLTASVAGSQS